MRYSHSTAFLIGLVLSLSLGFLDLSISMLSGRTGLDSFLSILPFLSAAVGVSFVIYLITWFLVAIHLGRLFKLGAFPLALGVSLFLFLGTSFALVLVSGLSDSDMASAKSLAKLLIVIVISFCISAQGYVATRAMTHRPNRSRTALVFFLAMPFVFAETMIFVWLHVYQVGAFLSMQSFLLNTGYIITVVFTVLGLYHKCQTRTVMRLLGALMILVLSSPLLTVIAAQTSKGSLSDFAGKDHKVKHVIVIIVDTLRVDVVSCYGSQSPATPQMDQLARDGIIFTKAISAAPWTLASVSSIMTGLSPSVHMATKARSRLPDAVTTLAEHLRDVGYFTGAIGYNPFLLPEFNTSQGFLDYHMFGASRVGCFTAELLRPFIPRQFGSEVTTSDLTEMAIHWLESNLENDFFLWIHYFDPHLPFAPPVQYLPNVEPPSRIGTEFNGRRAIRAGFLVPSLEEKAWIKTLYDSEVQYVDDNIGRLVASLKRLDLYDDALIVLTSDHGEEFWEHRGFEHGHTLYDELLRVPLIIKLPSAASKGRVDKFVTTASITPTILDLCAIRYEDNDFSVGSLQPLWAPNPEVMEEEPVFSTGLVYYEDRQSVVLDGFKYIRFLDGSHEELYDLVHDPEEQMSIASLSPDVVERARNTLAEHSEMDVRLRERYDLIAREKATPHQGTIRVLKSLGYIR